MKYILVRRIESYHQCYWPQSSSIGGAGGSTASKQGSVNSSRSGLFLFEFNIHSNLGNKSDQLGSRLSARSIIILHLHLLRIVL